MQRLSALTPGSVCTQESLLEVFGEAEGMPEIYAMCKENILFHLKSLSKRFTSIFSLVKNMLQFKIFSKFLIIQHNVFFPEKRWSLKKIIILTLLGTVMLPIESGRIMLYFNVF